jgi:steroid 5-alpha reductase family enzyme
MIIVASISLAFMLLVMLAAWTTVARTGDGGWTDVFWTFGTGASGLMAALAPWNSAPNPRQVLVALLVGLWAVRLGVYIAARVANGPEDARYARLRQSWGPRFTRNLLGLTIVQAPATMLLCLSIAVAAQRPGGGLNATDLVGAAILLVAIIGETTADAQMKRFKADPARRGAVMDQGLWAWSRHPNYFFEWLGWLAYPVIAIDLGGAWPQGWAALIAPVAMYGILNHLTGAPPLEAAMLASKGEAYAAYQARVSAFFLLPPRSRRQGGRRP